MSVIEKYQKIDMSRMTVCMVQSTFSFVLMIVDVVVNHGVCNGVMLYAALAFLLIAAICGVLDSIADAYVKVKTAQNSSLQALSAMQEIRDNLSLNKTNEKE
jgi:hypothetical protein